MDRTFVDRLVLGPDREPTDRAVEPIRVTVAEGGRMSEASVGPAEGFSHQSVERLEGPHQFVGVGTPVVTAPLLDRCLEVIDHFLRVVGVVLGHSERCLDVGLILIGQGSSSATVLQKNTRASAVSPAAASVAATVDVAPRSQRAFWVDPFMSCELLVVGIYRRTRFRAGGPTVCVWLGWAAGIP